MPKSSVSRGVARLESSVGAQLLYRTTRHVTLLEFLKGRPLSAPPKEG